MGSNPIEKYFQGLSFFNHVLETVQLHIRSKWQAGQNTHDSSSVCLHRTRIRPQLWKHFHHGILCTVWFPRGNSSTFWEWCQHWRTARVQGPGQVTISSFSTWKFLEFDDRSFFSYSAYDGPCDETSFVERALQLAEKIQSKQEKGVDFDCYYSADYYDANGIEVHEIWFTIQQSWILITILLKHFILVTSTLWPLLANKIPNWFILIRLLIGNEFPLVKYSGVVINFWRFNFIDY